MLPDPYVSPFGVELRGLGWEHCAVLKVVQQLHFVRCLPELLLSSIYSKPSADLFFRAQLSLSYYIFTQYTDLLTTERSKNSL